MKKTLFILAFLSVFTSYASAQTDQKTIIDDLNEYKRGEGSVLVMQDESIKRLIGANNTLIDPSSSGHFDERALINGTVDFVKVRGWKIQVFTGNRQNLSKEEAEQRQAEVREAFPALEATITYTTPTWRLRVGNFVDRDVAEKKMLELRKALPQFAKEMYLVQDTVKQPVSN